MRKDVFSGRWVIMAETATVRPSDFHFKKFVRETTFCPFCETNEASTPPEVFAIRPPGSSANGPGWSVRVVPNSDPRLRIEGELGRRAVGFHDLMNGVGAHEIIAETPRHDRSLHEFEIHEICDLMRAYVARIVDLEGDKRIRYVLIFKNHGEEAGAHTISHSISQLMALAVTPRSVKTKLITARDYFALKERCLYCDVLRQELMERKRLIAENEDFVAFAPFASRFPFEMAVFPKAHNSAFSRISPGQVESLSQILRDVLPDLCTELGLVGDCPLNFGPPRFCQIGFGTSTEDLPSKLQCSAGCCRCKCLFFLGWSCIGFYAESQPESGVASTGKKPAGPFVISRSRFIKR